MYRGAGLLESYQRQVQSLDGGLQELEENIDTVREVLSFAAVSFLEQLPCLQRLGPPSARWREAHFSAAQVAALSAPRLDIRHAAQRMLCLAGAAGTRHATKPRSTGLQGGC